MTLEEMQEVLERSPLFGDKSDWIMLTMEDHFTIPRKEVMDAWDKMKKHIDMLQVGLTENDPVYTLMFRLFHSHCKSTNIR